MDFVSHPRQLPLLPPIPILSDAALIPRLLVMQQANGTSSGRAS